VKEKYSDYKEIYVPEKKSFVDKVLAVVGNTKKSKYRFDTTPEIPPMRDNDIYTGEEDYLDPFGRKGKDELRKKKTTKSKTKRKSKKKGCGCK